MTAEDKIIKINNNAKAAFDGSEDQSDSLEFTKANAPEAGRKKTMNTFRNQIYSSRTLEALYEMNEDVSVSSQTVDYDLSYSEEIEEMQMLDPIRKSSVVSALNSNLEDDRSQYSYATSVSQLTFTTHTDENLSNKFFSVKKNPQLLDDQSCRVRARELLGEEFYEDKSLSTVQYDSAISRETQKTLGSLHRRNSFVVERLTTKLGIKKEIAMRMMLFGGYHDLNENQVEEFLNTSNALFLLLKEHLPNDEKMKVNIAAKLMKIYQIQEQGKINKKNIEAESLSNYLESDFRENIFQTKTSDHQINSPPEHTKELKDFKETDIHEMIGDANLEKKENEKAIIAYSRALELWRDSFKSKNFLQMFSSSIHERNKDTYEEFANLAIKLGEQLEESGQYVQAKERYLEAFSKQIQIYGKSHLKIAYTHRRLASAYDKSGQDVHALATYIKALVIFEKYEDKLDENEYIWKEFASTLFNMGRLYFKTGKTKKAILIYEKELDLVQKYASKDDKIMADLYNRFGLVYKHARNFQQSIKYHLKQLEVRKKMGNKKNLLALKQELGECYYLAEMYEESIKAYNEIVNEIGDKDKVAVLNRLSILFGRRNDYDQALECCLKARSICTKNADFSTEDIVMTYNNLGNVYSALDDTENALVSYNDALQLSKESRNPNDKYGSSTIYNIGILHMKKGTLKKADEYFTKFLETHSLIDVRDEKNKTKVIKMTRALNNKGIIRSQSGLYKAAIGFYEDSLELKTCIYGENSMELFGTQCNLGTAYFEIGQYEKARSLFLTLLQSMEKLGTNNLAKARVLNKLGNVSITAKQFQVALAYYTEALEIKANILRDKNHEEILITRQNIALALCQEEKYQEAIEMLLEIRELKISKLGECHPFIAKITLDIANAYLAIDSIKKAESYCIKAMKALDLAHVSNDHPYLRKSHKIFKRVIAKKNAKSEERRRKLKGKKLKKSAEKSESFFSSWNKSKPTKPDTEIKREKVSDIQNN